MSYFAYEAYVGTGSLSQFPINFPYFEQSDVTVTVAGVPATPTWINPNLISLSPAPAPGTAILIKRNTPVVSPEASFAGGPINSIDLNRNQTQVLYAVQELLDQCALFASSGVPIEPQFLPLNVVNMGADPTGAKDSTAIINGAMAIALDVYIPEGTYTVSATLFPRTNARVRGAGPNATVLRRTTNYGDTINAVNLGAGEISGMWLWHGSIPQQSAITLDDPITSGGSHISIQAGQGFTIKNCYLWRMTFGIHVENSAVFKIYDNNFLGIWDPQNTGKQEGIGMLAIGLSSYCQIGKVCRNYFGGQPSSPRPTSWTATDGSTPSQNLNNNVGSQVAVQVGQCEDLLVSYNYFGGNSLSNITGAFANGGVNLEWRITNNFFDGAGLTSSMITLSSTHDGSVLNGLVVEGNHFNGEFVSFNAITMINASGGGNQPAVVNFTISGNTSQATVGSFCLLYHARGGRITGNTIAGYNCYATSPGGDLTFCAAFWASTNCSGISASGNTIGGAVGNLSSPSYCYKTIEGQIHCVETYFNGAGAGGSQVGNQPRKPITVSNTNYVLTGIEEEIHCTTSSSAILITPTGSEPPGFELLIKDYAGTAGSHNVSFVGTVDGATNYAIGTNYGWARVKKLVNGNWGLVGHS